MPYRLAADATLLLHLAFVAFVVAGALAAFRWRWMPLLHLPAMAWGVFVELSGRLCPLTTLENALRRRAGDAGYGGGFVERYVLPVVYPEGLTLDVQVTLGIGVLLLNIGLYGAWFWLWRARRAAGDEPGRSNDRAKG